MSENSPIVLTIDKIVSKGEGLARDENSVWFIPGVLPQEKVSVIPTTKRKNFCRGEVLAILEPSVHRVEPFCPYYDQCGGCDMQHIDLDEQVAIKKEIVLENLKRIGKIEVDEASRTFTYGEPFSGQSLAYRKRVRFQVDLKNQRVGFIAKKSHQVVDIHSCPILSQSLNEFLGAKRELLLKRAKELSLQRHLAIVSVPAIEGDGGKVSINEETICVTVNEKPLFVNATVFFQTHQEVLSHMIDVVKRWSIGDTIIDLYSGIGTFASCVEKEGREVFAIERDRKCVALAKKHLTNTTFFTDDAELWIKKFPHQKVGTIIVDPPRAGLAVDVISSIRKIKPTHLIYISCDSATFSRDANLLIEKGYSLDTLEYLEMYPHTSHTETMALFIFDTHEEKDS